MASKKKAAANAKARPKKGGLAVEITGVLLLFFALFALISLGSYDANDPSFASAPAPGTPVHNFAGRVGAAFAEGLFWLLGFMAFLLPFVAGWAAVKAIFHGTSAQLLRRLAGALLLFLIVCPFAAILLVRIPWGGNDIPAGGIVGRVLLDFLERYLNTVGSFVLLLAALALYLLFSTRWSVRKTFHFFKGTFDTTIKQVRIKVVRYQRDKERDRMRERVQRKYAAPLPVSIPAVEDPLPDKRAEKQAERERRRQEKESAKAARKVPILAPKPAAPPAQKPLLPDLGVRDEYRF